jgi:hypothetical protein
VNRMQGHCVARSRAWHRLPASRPATLPSPCSRYAHTALRPTPVQVVCRWDELRHMGPLPVYEQQILALEALQASKI